MDRGHSDRETERKVALKGTSRQISEAKKMIEEKVKDSEFMMNSVSNSRQPRIKTKQPLFLSCDDNDEGATVSDKGLILTKFNLFNY